jgi:hypothetical protein
MTGMASQPANAPQPSNRLRAPADRPTGERGGRAPLAGVVAVAALFPLTLGQVEARDPAWTRPVLLLAGVAGIAAAVLLWTGRRRLTLVLAVGLTLFGLMGTVAAVRARSGTQSEVESFGGAAFDYPDRRGRPLTHAEAEAVPKGLTRAQLRGRLGRPSTRGIQRVFDAPDLRCLAYRSAGAHPAGRPLHAFCFRDGRYAALREW